MSEEEKIKKVLVYFDFWPMQRPLTKHWGSGLLFNRICKEIGIPDVAFGKTDGIPEEVLAVDLNCGFNWSNLPFEDNKFNFGYWDPPYDKLYKAEGKEIWRTCKNLAILHTYVYPTSWFESAHRIGMIAVTFGPLKQVRILQIFQKGNLKQGDYILNKPKLTC